MNTQIGCDKLLQFLRILKKFDKKLYEHIIFINWTQLNEFLYKHDKVGHGTNRHST